ncbi:hypothetical protein ACLKA7_011976 [Drosophila subpalustris]
MNICRLSPRQSDFSAIRAGRSLQEELQRRQYQQMPFGSMTSFASNLLNAELQQQQQQQQQQDMKSRGYHGSDRKADRVPLNRRMHRLGKDSKPSRIKNPLQVLLMNENKRHTGSGAKDNSRGTSGGTSRLNRFNGKPLNPIDDDDDDDVFLDYIELKDEGDYGHWPDQLKACEPPRRCPYCSGDEGHIAKRPSVRKRSVYSSDGNSDGDGDGRLFN